MQLLRLAIALTIATLLFACTSQPPQDLSEESSSEIPHKQISTPLKSVIEDLRVIKIKVEASEGINLKEYGENIADLANAINKVYGDPKALSSVKSAIRGHQLAVRFWQCDRVDGYEQMHQCQDNVLKAVFVKYPDIKAQAKAAVAGESLPFISAGLDKEAVLQAIWKKTGADTDAAVRAVTVPPSKKDR
jgi:hypothetical protein